MIMVFTFISIFLTGLFIVFFIIMYGRYKKLNSDIMVLKKTIHKIRYGNINVRLSNLNNKELENSVNKLIETIYDREMMIKEYQTTLANKNLSLEEILKQEKEIRKIKEDFATTLTHDMKVPVIAELNSIEYLLEGRFGTVNEKQKQVLNLMLSSIKELKDLIENILETYRLEQKELRLNIKPVNFNDFLVPVIEEMYPISTNTGHKLVYKIDKTKNLIVNIDSFQIKRIIKNLIQNAIAYSPNDSEIKIETNYTEKNVKFVISNKGNNISKDDLNLIFQKYYSGHSKFRKAGTGLGLYISEQIAVAHNGNIDVENSKDGITSFILTIPLNIVS